MQTKSKKKRKFRFTALAVTCLLALNGCGTISAGTALSTEENFTIASKSASVTWFDGNDLQTTNINVGRSVEVSDLPFRPDLSRIPLSETTGLRCFQITSSDDISSLYDMQALTTNKEPLMHVGTIYDGAVYPLGMDWYGVVLPNGFDEPYYIRIGQTYFETY